MGTCGGEEPPGRTGRVNRTVTAQQVGADAEVREGTLGNGQSQLEDRMARTGRDTGLRTGRPCALESRLVEVEVEFEFEDEDEDEGVDVGGRQGLAKLSRRFSWDGRWKVVGGQRMAAKGRTLGRAGRAGRGGTKRCLP
ncbi:hypothetical protein DHEL01_v209580 [Diaporthe helianthi]|uniref:Uncharacterized protein n=1 Tax=Diaporthe helianthi TaxID=158607 RepID=A0A2P5HP27_DIAHE|nr:hypothetical protein DHEL01_v209580 [Diaporthe helianthi]